MFLCLQTLPARLDDLTYSLLRSSGKPCSFLSDTWGLGPWGQSLSPQRSGVTVAGHSFAAASGLTACIPLPPAPLCSLTGSWYRQFCTQIGTWKRVCSLCTFTSECVSEPVECALCTPLMCSKPSPSECRARQSLCFLYPPQYLSCSDSGFPDLGDPQRGSCQNMCRPRFNSDLLIGISKIWLKEFLFFNLPVRFSWSASLYKAWF